MNYECNDEYTTDGSPAHSKKKFSVSCLINGAMESMSACQKIKCGTPPTATNAVLQSPSQYSMVTVGGTVSFRCITGHKIGGTGNGASTFSIKCKKDGTFEPVKACKPVVCGPPPGQNWAW